MGVVGLVFVLVVVVVAVVAVVVAALAVVVGRGGVVVLVLVLVVAAAVTVAATMAAWDLDMVAAVARAGSRALAPRCATTSAVDMVLGGEGEGPGTIFNKAVRSAYSEERPDETVRNTL